MHCNLWFLVVLGYALARVPCLLSALTLAFIKSVGYSYSVGHDSLVLCLLLNAFTLFL